VIRLISQQASGAVVSTLLVALLAILPVWLGHHPYYVNIASQILLWAVAALALNVVVGYAGLVSLGHAGLLAMAGYTVGLLLQAGFGHLLACLGAVAVTLAASAVFAVGAQIDGHRLSMITLALGQIVWGIAYRWASLTNGDNGINLAADPRRSALAWREPSRSTTPPSSFSLLLSCRCGCSCARPSARALPARATSRDA
jgi:branched-chain amino acid transport system permease protein